MHVTSPVTTHISLSGKANHGDQAFCNLSDETKSHFDALGAAMSYSRGETMFSEGELARHVFILLSGRVKLSVSSSEGKTLILTIAQSGQVLGLNAVLTAGEHEASAEALEHCEVRAIPAREFTGFLEKHPDAAMEATRCVLKEYQVVFNDIRRLALSTTVAGRLANLLLDWLGKRQPSASGTSRFTVALTHGEIADMTGTSRETVSRTLQRFQKDKLISIKGASFTVLRPDALQQLAV